MGDPTIPTLNLVGCEDQYFGRTNSVAAKVAQATDLPAVRGHAFETMVERGITHGLVCHFEGAVHTLLRTHDTVVREVLADFLQRPHHTCLKLAVHWERIPHLRSLIRRYRRHHEGNCRVQYVRFCAPRSEQIVGGLDKEEHAELMRRVDRVLYQSGKSKGKTLQGGGTNSDGATPLMERLASVISALHTSSNAPVHTSVSLSQKLPVFVEKVEEQLVGILQEEARSSMPKSPKSPLRQSGYSKLSDAFAPGKENGISPPKKETSPTKERAANAAREVPSSNGGPKPAEASSKTEAHIASDAPSQAPSIGGVRLIQRDLAKGGASKARTREGTARKAVIVDEPLEEQHARLPGPVAQPSPEPLATYGVAGTELATSLIRSAEAVAEAVREHAQCMRQAGFCIGAGALCLCAAVLMVRFYRL